MECPNDETLLALIEGRLREGALLEVDTHLDGCESCRDLVGALAVSSGTRATAGHPPLASDARVGRFVILERMGEGAMGVVLSAYDPELDRKVAIKLLHPSSDGAQSRARLVREAQAMARLSHPNVVTVYDVGTHGDSVYVAMELVDGASLRGWLATPRASTAVLEVFRQAALGLAAAHDAGLVHRDFKPENVLVDARGVVKVGDFGLATAAAVSGEALPESSRSSPSKSESASLTHTGALLGTPAYMAPEQLAGERAEKAADQFAFGVSLFEALEGTRPFAFAKDTAALRAAIVAGPPASRRMDRRTDALVRRMLAAAPEQRHPSMHAVALALAPLPRRGPWLGIGAAVVLGTIAFLTLRPADAATCVAESPSLDATGLVPAAVPVLEAWTRAWSSAHLDACQDTTVRHAQSEARMDARMACLDRQRGAFEATVRTLRAPDGVRVAADVLDMLPAPASCEAEEFSTAPPEGVDALEREIDEAVLRNAAADHVGALALAESLVERAGATHYAPIEAEAELARADVLRALARHDEAIEAARRGLLSAERAGDQRSVVRGWLSIVRSLGAAGRYAEAATPARHADAALERAGSPPDLLEGVLRTRGILRTNLGELEGARRDLTEALSLLEERTGEESLAVADVHTNLGNLALVGVRFEDALREHEAALRIDREGLGDAHPRVGCDLHNVAGVLKRLGRRDEARTHYLEALRVSSAALGPNHPDVGITLNSLGLLAYEDGDRDEARRRWEAAMLVLEDHGDGALVHYNLSLLALVDGRYEDARAQAAAAVAADETHLGGESRRVSVALIALGRALDGLDRPEEGRAALARARDIAVRLEDQELTSDADTALGALDATPITLPRISRRAPRETAPVAETPVAETPVASPDPGRPSPSGVGAYGGRQAW